MSPVLLYVFFQQNGGSTMAQSLKSKVRKLAEQFNIDAIINTAKEVQLDIQDEQAWDQLSNPQKLQWFYDQCSMHGLTTKHFSNQISIIELPAVGKHNGTRAYFCVFLPKDMHEDGMRETEFHLEIGSAYANAKAGEIWPTAKGLKGKEKQIAEVIRLNKLGK